MDDINYPIDLAVRAGNLKIVKYLIENCDDIKLENVVFLAAKYGNIDVLDYLLFLGLELDSEVNPLYGACWSSDIEAVSRLLIAGSNPNIISSPFELTPIIVAASDQDNLEIVKNLVIYGADYNLGCEGRFPIISSCYNNCTDISEFLINLGYDINCHDLHIRTPLIYACIEDYLEIVKLLLKHGADVNIVDTFGRKAIDYCISDECRSLFI